MSSEAEFPPRNWQDIFVYDEDEVAAGYREHVLGDPVPGPNRAPGYRWGWANARKDRTYEPDGFERVRAEYIRAVMPHEGRIQ